MLYLYIRKLTLGEGEEVGKKDQKEDEMLPSQALALSLENEEENDEEELLKQAIALSLEM